MAVVEKYSTDPNKKRVSRRKDNTLCKGQRLRLYPTPEQEALLNQWMGCSRYVWNWALCKQAAHYEKYQLDEKIGIPLSGHKKHLKEAEISKQLTLLRQTEGFEWLLSCPFTVLNMSLQNLKKSWRAFYDGKTGTRIDMPGQPQFRSKFGSRESVCFQIDYRIKNVLDTENQVIKIPGLGPVKVIVPEPLVGDISSISVKRKGRQWYVSLSLINVDPKDVIRNFKNSKIKDAKTNHSKYQNFPEDPTDTTLNPNQKGLAALDLSVVSGAVATSDGQTTTALFGGAVLRSDERAHRRKAKYQRVYARKQEQLYARAGIKRDKNGAWTKGVNKVLRDQGIHKNTKRMEDLNNKIAVCSLHEVFRKHDAIHKFTTQLVQNHHTIVVETLMLHAMAQTLSRGFRRRMHEACMGEILRQLKYKCAWHNRSLVFVDKWFPSSKRCSNSACHEKNKHLLLKDRMWLCTSCNTQHVRDDNASFNLWQEGWRLLDEVFQQNNTSVLAAGSVVRGTQGIIVEALRKSPKANNYT